ncbi:MAG: hypothetical protein QXJ68_06860 [Methanocellales archaeon]
MDCTIAFLSIKNNGSFNFRPEKANWTAGSLLKLEKDCAEIEGMENGIDSTRSFEI